MIFILVITIVTTRSKVAGCLDASGPTMSMIMWVIASHTKQGDLVVGYSNGAQLPVCMSSERDLFGSVTNAKKLSM